MHALIMIAAAGIIVFEVLVFGVSLALGSRPTENPDTPQVRMPMWTVTSGPSPDGLNERPAAE